MAVRKVIPTRHLRRLKGLVLLGALFLGALLLSRPLFLGHRFGLLMKLVH